MTTLSADAEPTERANPKGGRLARRRKYQHGSLFRRGKRDKVWVGRWWEDAVSRDGTFRSVRRSEVLGTVAELPTRRDAEQVLAGRLRRVNSGDNRPQSSCTFREFVQDTWLPEVLPTLKYSSQKHYEYLIRVHLLPALGEVHLRVISREGRVQGLSNTLHSARVGE